MNHPDFTGGFLLPKSRQCTHKNLYLINDLRFNLADIGKLEQIVSRSDMSDLEWEFIKCALPNKSRGVKRVDDRRVITAGRQCCLKSMRGMRAIRDTISIAPFADRLLRHTIARRKEPCRLLTRLNLRPGFRRRCRLFMKLDHHD